MSPKPKYNNTTPSTNAPTDQEALKSLHRRWYVYAMICLTATLLGLAGLRGSAGRLAAERWSFTTILLMVIILSLSWRGLGSNLRPDETRLLPVLGAGNVVTLGRGVLIALLSGFLMFEKPDGWLGWVPGLLYFIAILGDLLDGTLARLSKMPTRLGEFLDMEFDSLGVLVAASLTIHYQQTPPWYILVGLARYLFIVGILIRKRSGLKSAQLLPSIRRRLLAGSQMGLMAFLLLPIFSPPATYWVATAFGLPFLAGFIWDWFYTIQWIHENEENAIVERRITNWAGFLLRWIATGLWLYSLFIQQSAFDAKSWMVVLQWVVGLTIAAGVFGRVGAFLGLMTLGFIQTFTPLSGTGYLLIFIYSGILFLGTGPFSLFSPEEQLINHRIAEG